MSLEISTEKNSGDKYFLLEHDENITCAYLSKSNGITILNSVMFKYKFTENKIVKDMEFYRIFKELIF